MSYLTRDEYERTLDLSKFFNDYWNWQNGESDDPGDLPERENQLAPTEIEWAAYYNRQKAKAVGAF